MFPIICPHVPLDLQGISKAEERLRTVGHLVEPRRLDINLVTYVKRGTQL